MNSLNDHPYHDNNIDDFQNVIDVDSLNIFNNINVKFDVTNTGYISLDIEILQYQDIDSGSHGTIFHVSAINLENNFISEYAIKITSFFRNNGDININNYREAIILYNLNQNPINSDDKKSTRRGLVNFNNLLHSFHTTIESVSVKDLIITDTSRERFNNTNIKMGTKVYVHRMPFYQRSLWDLMNDHYVFIPLFTQILYQILTGLISLHDMKIFHGDIKPDNILINDKNHVCIGDFGAVKFYNSLDLIENIPLYQYKFSGTEIFRSPEEFLNQDSSPIGDIWSLGITLLSMISSTFYQTMFQRSTQANFAKQYNAEIYFKHFYQQSEPIDVSKICHQASCHDKRIQSIIKNCLEINVDKRFTARLLMKKYYNIPVPRFTPNTSLQYGNHCQKKCYDQVFKYIKIINTIYNAPQLTTFAAKIALQYIISHNDSEIIVLDLAHAAIYIAQLYIYDRSIFRFLIPDNHIYHNRNSMIIWLLTCVEIYHVLDMRSTIFNIK